MPEGNQLVYSTYLGGSDNENYYPELEELGSTYGGIAIDSIGNAYVTGLTRSSDFPTHPAHISKHSKASRTHL